MQTWKSYQTWSMWMRGHTGDGAGRRSKSRRCPAWTYELPSATKSRTRSGRRRDMQHTSSPTILPCCVTASAAVEPASTRPSSLTATSICSATTASTSIEPCRTLREARSWWCACPRPGQWCSPATPCTSQENLDKNILPSVGSVYDPVGMLDAYAWVRRVRDVEGADIIYAHDPDTFKAHKLALPEFYE